MFDFLVCFYVLDHCFWMHPDRCGMTHQDDLGILLGEMDPGMMADGLPIDPAVPKDWQEVVPSLPETDAGILEAIDRFLDYYEAHEGFAFPLSRPMLRLPEILAYVPEAKKQAAETCERHHY